MIPGSDLYRYHGRASDVLSVGIIGGFVAAPLGAYASLAGFLVFAVPAFVWAVMMERQ